MERSVHTSLVAAWFAFGAATAALGASPQDLQQALDAEPAGRVPGTREAGTGLGLSIARRVAELHGATVRFQDGPGGRGLAVVVEIPAA